MVRDTRVKNIDFTSAQLTAGAGSSFDVYGGPINGRIQAVYYTTSNIISPTGSLFIGVSGVGIVGGIGNILSMVSGTATGHNLGESWVVFPRATTVTTNGVPLSGANGYNYFSEIGVNSVIRVVGSALGGVGSQAGGLSITYI